jgi:hypothetical protein
MIGNVYGIMFVLVLDNGIIFSFAVENTTGITVGIVLGIIIMNKK